MCAVKTSGANVRLYTIESTGDDPGEEHGGEQHGGEQRGTAGSRGSRASSLRSSGAHAIVDSENEAPWPTTRRASDRRMKAGPLPMSTHFDSDFL